MAARWELRLYTVWYVWTHIPHPLPSTCQPRFDLTVNQDMWLLVQPCWIETKASKVVEKNPELWHVECVFLLCLPETVSVLPSTRWTALKRLENTTSPTVQRVATFFVNSSLIGSLECKAACDWPRVSCWPKVDSQRVGDAGSEKKKKNSSYKTAPCASPEWGWNNHREDACTQKYIKLWQRLTILELPRYDFTFSTRFYRHNRRRRCPPAMTPHNYTGNFVLTPAVSMDANRSANSLLPQLVWLLLLPTLQSFTGSVHVVDNPESDYDSPHHHFCFVVVFYLKTTQLKLLLLVAWEQQLDTLCSSWPSISNKRNSHSPSLNHAFKWGFPLENIVVTLSDLGFNLYSRLCRCVVT